MPQLSGINITAAVAAGLFHRLSPCSKYTGPADIYLIFCFNSEQTFPKPLSAKLFYTKLFFGVRFMYRTNTDGEKDRNIQALCLGQKNVFYRRCLPAFRIHTCPVFLHRTDAQLFKKADRVLTGKLRKYRSYKIRFFAIIVFQALIRIRIITFSIAGCQYFLCRLFHMFQHKNPQSFPRGGYCRHQTGGSCADYDGVVNLFLHVVLLHRCNLARAALQITIQLLFIHKIFSVFQFLPLSLRHRMIRDSRMKKQIFRMKMIDIQIAVFYF